MKSATQPTVLVVEDEEPIRRLLASLLAPHGIQVYQAGDAAEALAVVRHFGATISLAIIDMVMPGTSGFDVATEIIREYPSIPILYTSGYTGSIAMEGIARRSPDTVLFKPFTEQELLGRVRRLLAPGTDAGAPAGRV